MKAKNLKSINWGGLLLFVLGILFGFADASALAAAAAPVVSDGLADAGRHVQDTAVDTPITNAESPELLDKAIDERVVRILPEDHIFDIIARTNGRSVNINSLTYRYYSVDTLPNSAKVTTALAEGTSATSKLVVDNPDHFAVKDTILVPSVNGFDRTGTTETPNKKLMLYVCGRDSSGLTVQAVNGKKSGSYFVVPAIAKDAIIYRMAKAATEGEMRSSSYSVLPTPEDNLCQIFQTEVSMSTIMQMHKKEVDWTFTDVEEMAIGKMLREMEASFRWGAGGTLVDANTQGTVNFTEGIINQIENVIQYDSANLGNDTLIELSKGVFVGNNGSKQRILLAGSGFVANVSKIPSVQKQIDSREVTVVWGLRWDEIRTNFGTLLMKYDTTLDEYGWADKAIVIDPNYLCKAYFKKLSRRAIDTIASGQFDGKVTQLEEISCMVIKNKPCHFIIEPAPVDDDGGA